MPNASSNKLFDAHPRSSEAAPSTVIQPSVIYVSRSANRISASRGDAGVESLTRFIVDEVLVCIIRRDPALGNKIPRPVRLGLSNVRWRIAHASARRLHVKTHLPAGLLAFRDAQSARF